MSKKLKCILLIDDDEDDNYFHQVIIQKMNIAEQVQIAESGMEALDILAKTDQVPDLILLDINMPRMNGWEFLDHYHDLYKSSGKSVVIIILTTSVNPSEKERSKLTPGISGFISKPVTEKMMADILATHFPTTKEDESKD